jgi:protein-S-isoprenylcysteine O-methyltransferase Ste14
MKNAWLKNLRDIIILPFSVTCIVPYLIYDRRENFIPDNTLVRITGGILIAGGLSLFAWTVYLFNRIGKGTLAPWSPKEKLVIHGPYRYCRNPMITSVLLILIGESLLLHSTSILTWALIFFTINTFYFILFEEPGLAKKFGERYLEYRNHVPRWIPRMKPYKSKD